MRNVTRTARPRSLTRFGDHWAAELATAIDAFRLNTTPIRPALFNRYRTSSVLAALKAMYGDDECSYCCYCESRIADCSFERIEHRRPKAVNRFPESCFEWDNLHLICEKCNIAKGDKWDDAHPILDAVVDAPINAHLSYRVADTYDGVYREPLTSRGKTTVDHADLDRVNLRTTRIRLWVYVMRLITRIHREIGIADPRAASLIQELRDKCRREHGSLIEHILREWGLVA